MALGLFFFSSVPLEAADTDTFRVRQWYLDKLQVPEAWTFTTGQGVVVAVIDSGVDIGHPDLKDNIWINPDEIADNGLDDDGDGLVDDVHGWNFVNNSADVRPDPVARRESWIHGTVVASLIAAKNDGFGMAGVSPDAKIMPLVAIGPDGYGRDDVVVAAIKFAAAHGADVINLSFSGLEYDRALEQAIAQATAQGILVVSAAGNGSTEIGDDLDATRGYPACNKGAGKRGELTVSGLDAQGQHAAFANFGGCIDVSAPGSNVFAAQPIMQRTGESAGGFVNGLGGTSVAAPLVSGIAALLKAEHPTWSGVEIAQRIKQTTRPMENQAAAYQNKMGSGLVNALQALVRDGAMKALDSKQLQAAAPGQAPAVRLLNSAGEVLSEFLVSSGGDRRGVRAALVRWSGADKPEIAVTAASQGSSAINVYRDDGVLMAAFKVDGAPRGGLLMSAQDLDGDGLDTLLLAEAGGNQVWLVDSKKSKPEQLNIFKAGAVNGVTPFAVDRPIPSFLLSAKNGEAVWVGADGILSKSKFIEPKIQNYKIKNPKKIEQPAWMERRVSAGGNLEIFASAGNRSLVRISGVSLRSEQKLQPGQTLEAPAGEIAEPGWRFYSIWPR